MAIDLRVIDQMFKKKLEELLPVLLSSHFKSQPTHAAQVLFSALLPRLEAGVSLDSEARFLNAFKQTAHILLTFPVDIEEARSWPFFAASQAALVFKRNREQYFEQTGTLHAEEWLGKKNSHLYRFVRKHLGIGPRRGDVHLGRHEGRFRNLMSSAVVCSNKFGSRFRLCVRRCFQDIRVRSVRAVVQLHENIVSRGGYQESL